VPPEQRQRRDTEARTAADEPGWLAAWVLPCAASASSLRRIRLCLREQRPDPERRASRKHAERRVDRQQMPVADVEVAGEREQPVDADERQQRRARVEAGPRASPPRSAVAPVFQRTTIAASASTPMSIAAIVVFTENGVGEVPPPAGRRELSVEERRALVSRTAP
jgi:hypothetical protein